MSRFSRRSKNGDEYTEFRKNRQAYESEHRKELERDHMDEVALMHDGELVEIFKEIGEANVAGRNRYGEGKFSLITVGLDIDLGALNHLVR